MNWYMAKVGMNVLYRMIFYDNFIHSDCHAGNVLVQVRKGKPVEQTYKQKLEDYITFTLVPFLINLLSKNKDKVMVIPKTKVNTEYDIKMAFIDAGMITSLSEKDQ